MSELPYYNVFRLVASGGTKKAFIGLRDENNTGLSGYPTMTIFCSTPATGNGVYPMSAEFEFTSSTTLKWGMSRISQNGLTNSFIGSFNITKIYGLL